MTKIEFGFTDDGKIYLSSDFDRRDEPVVLNDDEKVAIEILTDILDKVGAGSDDTHLERRSYQYLSVVTNIDCDFLRIKTGPKSNWFSIDLPAREEPELESDPRLASVKNKQQRHWKIELSCIDDLSDYDDLIQKSYHHAKNK